MKIGVPKEIKVQEHRVGMTPVSAREAVEIVGRLIEGVANQEDELLLAIADAPQHKCKTHDRALGVPAGSRQCEPQTAFIAAVLQQRKHLTVHG